MTGPLRPPSRWHSPVVRQGAAALAVVAFAFVLFVTVELALTLRLRQADRPIDHPQLVALREQLAREPGSEALLREIRQDEQRLRAAFLTGQRRLQQGAWLLLVGGAVCVFAAKLARAGTGPVALPSRPLAAGPPGLHPLAARLAVGTGTASLFATALLLPFLGGTAGEAASARGVWQRFRGAGGLGISPYAKAPRELDARAGRERNLLWKTVLPLPGMSSPVVWNERVYATGASPTAREVYCLDALTGRILWRRPVSAGPESSAVPERVYHETGYAAPTPVTDGARVFALFANGDVVCFDSFGVQQWCVSVGLPDNLYGLASSPLLHQDRLLLQLDQEPGENGPRSALLALDAATGKQVWRTPREVASSWPTPVPLAGPAGTQLVTCANPFVIAYDPADGRELWRFDGLAGDGGPSPAVAEGLVLAVNVASPLVAIRPDGAGDVTRTHAAWRWDDNLPDVCSPLAADGLVWLQSTTGLTTCLDARTGEKVFEHDHGVAVYASPALAGGAVYLIGRKGKVVVFAAERSYRELATGDLGEACDSSPAFAEGRVYVRGARHLFCFAEGDS
ncbi:MAG: PQQ-like beta-propeller repeat protein [Planctomycetes bacterium]|nr:PQQ-like beta-propeller repeat protein [Planctomycetota bacterium]